MVPLLVQHLSRLNARGCNVHELLGWAWSYAYATKGKDQRAKPGKGQRHPWKAEHESWLNSVIRGHGEAAKERRAQGLPVAEPVTRESILKQSRADKRLEMRRSSERQKCAEAAAALAMRLDHWELEIASFPGIGLERVRRLRTELQTFAVDLKRILADTTQSKVLTRMRAENLSAMVEHVKEHRNGRADWKALSYLVSAFLPDALLSSASPEALRRAYKVARNLAQAP